MRIEQMQWLLEVGQEIGKLQVENEELHADLDFAEEHGAFDTVIEINTGPSEEDTTILRNALEGTEQCHQEALDKIDGLESELADVNERRGLSNAYIQSLESDLKHYREVNEGLMEHITALRDMLTMPPPATFNQNQLFALLCAMSGTAGLADSSDKTRYLLWSVERNRFESTELEPMNYVRTHPEENGKVRLIMTITPQAYKLETFRLLRNFLHTQVGQQTLGPPVASYSGKPPETEPHDPLVQAAERAIGGRTNFRYDD
jgi:hypothetical protein